MLVPSFKRLINQNVVIKRFFVRNRNGARENQFRANGSPVAKLFIVGANSPDSVVNAVWRTKRPDLYAFNCSEGFQRLSMDADLSMPNVNYVFLTSDRWSHYAGLFSSFITKQEFNIPITIFGPKSVEKKIDAMVTHYSGRKFVHCTDDVLVEDNAMSIRSIPLGSDGDTFAYSVIINEYYGRFDIEKCVDADVPLSAFKDLAAGTDVTLDDGRLIKSVDVHTGASPRQEFMGMI